MISFAQLKKFFIFSFIGSLVVAALVAVVTVLIGQFNEVTSRVFFTLFMVVLHSLVSLAFIWDDSRNNTFDRLAFFVNTIFVLVVLSFVASLFGIWKIVSAENVWNIYQTFFIIAFASLHSDILSKAMRKENYMDGIIYANYVFIALVVLMLQPIIYMFNAPAALGEMYYRLLAAVGIIDGTLSVLTIIFYKLYTHNHPEIKAPTTKRGFSIWVWILLVYLSVQFLWIIFGLFSRVIFR